MAAIERHNWKKGSNMEQLLPNITRTLKIFQNKFVYYWAVINFFLHCVLIILLVVEGLTDFTAEFWLADGTLLVISVALTMQLSICLLFHQKWQLLKDSYENQLPWDLTKMLPTSRKRIQRLSKEIETMFLLFCTSVTCVGFIGHLSFIEQEIKIIYSLPFMGIIDSSGFRLMWAIFIFLSTEFMTLTLNFAIYYSYYFVALTMFQFIDLNCILEEFQKSPAKYNNKLVKEKLIFIVKRHQSIIGEFNKGYQLMILQHVLFSTSLMLCGLYFVLLFYSPHYGYFQSLPTFISFVLITFYFSHQGQMFEDLNENLYSTLYELNWYDWDSENKKIFRFLFLNTSRSLQTQATNITKINHDYFKQAMKITYTLVNLTRNTSNFN